VGAADEGRVKGHLSAVTLNNVLLKFRLHEIDRRWKRTECLETVVDLRS
jgi:hypothetical protein